MSVKWQTSCLSLDVLFIIQYVFAQQIACDWHIISETDTMTVHDNLQNFSRGG